MLCIHKKKRSSTTFILNDAENSALHHRNKLYFKIYSDRKQLFQIVIIFHVYCIFDQVNIALSGIKEKLNFIDSIFLSNCRSSFLLGVQNVKLYILCWILHHIALKKLFFLMCIFI